MTTIYICAEDGVYAMGHRGLRLDTIRDSAADLAVLRLSHDSGHFDTGPVVFRGTEEECRAMLVAFSAGSDRIFPPGGTQLVSLDLWYSAGGAWPLEVQPASANPEPLFSSYSLAVTS